MKKVEALKKKAKKLVVPYQRSVSEDLGRKTASDPRKYLPKVLDDDGKEEEKMPPTPGFSLKDRQAQSQRQLTATIKNNPGAAGSNCHHEDEKVREGNKRGLAKLAKHLAEGRAKKVAKLKAKILKAEKAEEKAPHTPKKRKDTEAEKITKKINNAVKVKKAQMSAALRRELAKAHEADRVKLAHIKDVETKAQKRTAKKVSNKIKNAIKAVNGSSKKPREEKPKAPVKPDPRKKRQWTHKLADKLAQTVGLVKKHAKVHRAKADKKTSAAKKAIKSAEKEAAKAVKDHSAEEAAIMAKEIGFDSNDDDTAEDDFEEEY